MAWILDEYSKFHGHSPAVVTGKPIVSLKLERVVCGWVDWCFETSRGCGRYKCELIIQVFCL